MHRLASLLRIHPGRRPSKLVRLACAISLIFALPVSAADDFVLDKVVIKSGAGNSEIAAVGRIVDYTGAGLTFRAKDGGATATFPVGKVVSVETPQSKPHVAGLQAFAEGQTDKAVTELKKALEQETRSWVRREIRAMLIRCANRQDDRISAVSHFMELIRSDPTTMHFKLIPLVWTADAPSDSLQTAARGWLNQSEEAVQLIAASVLLSNANDESSARIHLERLARTTDPRIYWPAEAQLWRSRLTADNLDRQELARWETRIDEIPVALRGGPYYVLGQGHLRLEEYERAAMSMLWVPLVYHDDHQLAARACLESAEALAQIGQSREALTLYREVADRFGETAFALQAVQKIAAQAGGPAAVPNQPETAPPSVRER